MKKLLLIALLFSFVFTCRAQQTAIPKDSVYTITEDNDTSCINQLILQCDTNRYVVAEIYCADGSSIDFCGKYTDRLSHPYVVYTLYNAATDGSSFFIYNLQTHKAYLTNGYFSDLSPVCGAISFACQELLLAPMGTANSTPTDTIDADTREEHITYPTSASYVRTKIHPISIDNLPIKRSRTNSSTHLSLQDKEADTGIFRRKDTAFDLTDEGDTPVPYYSGETDSTLFSVYYIGKTARERNFWSAYNKRGFWKQHDIEQHNRYSRDIETYLKTYQKRYYVFYIMLNKRFITEPMADEFTPAIGAVYQVYILKKHCWQPIGTLTVDHALSNIVPHLFRLLKQ